jgi:hypothetical protein
MVSTSGSEEATCDKFDEKKSGSRLADEDFDLNLEHGWQKG